MRWLIRRIIGPLTVLLLGGALAQTPGEIAPGLQRAKAVHARNSAALFESRGVVATGVGINTAGKPVIKVYVEQPDYSRLPPSVEGVPVDVLVSGPVYARRGNCDNSDANPAACKPGQPFASPGSSGATDRYERPVPIGVSTGHTNITAGTIGCRVSVGCHQYALSNNHVFADEGAAAIGDDVIQPGPYDGGEAPGDVIGTLYDFEPIIFSTSASNMMDAALILLDGATVADATLPDGYGLPRKESIEAVPNMDVKKYGRTTGLTTGRVDAIDVTVNVGYDNGTARFVGQIIIRPGLFSAGGDSGSLIVVDGGANDRRPLGLLFAGSNSVTVANPIQPVLDRFGAVIDGELGQ